MVNQRPLVGLTSESSLEQAICPSSLVFGSFTSNQEFDVSEYSSKESIRKRWRARENRYLQFKRIWQKQYLATLSTRSYWQRPAADLQVGDLVLVEDKAFMRQYQYPLGRVLALPDPENKLQRTVTVQMGCKKATKYNADKSMDVKASFQGPPRTVQKSIRSLIPLECEFSEGDRQDLQKMTKSLPMVRPENLSLFTQLHCK